MSISEERKQEIVETDLTVCFQEDGQRKTALARFRGSWLPFPHLRVRIGADMWADFGEYSWDTAHAFALAKIITL